MEEANTYAVELHEGKLHPFTEAITINSFNSLDDAKTWIIKMMSNYLSLTGHYCYCDILKNGRWDSQICEGDYNRIIKTHKIVINMKKNNNRKFAAIVYNKSSKTLTLSKSFVHRMVSNNVRLSDIKFFKEIGEIPATIHYTKLKSHNVSATMLSAKLAKYTPESWGNIAITSPFKKEQKPVVHGKTVKVKPKITKQLKDSPMIHNRNIPTVKELSIKQLDDNIRQKLDAETDYMFKKHFRKTDEFNGKIVHLRKEINELNAEKYKRLSVAA